MIKESVKTTIDNMTYESMFSLWRFAKVGHPMFQGETGKYFSEVMKEKRKLISDEEHTRISKDLGW
jgi:hypothetical protein